MKVRLGLVVSLLLSCGGDAVDSGRCSDDKAVQKCPCPGVNDIQYGERRCKPDGSYGPCLGCPSPDGAVNPNSMGTGGGQTAPSKGGTTGSVPEGGTSGMGAVCLRV